MTTQVTISSPSPNHLDLKVVGEYLDSAGNHASIASTQVLTDGESCTLHVHGSMRVVVTEVGKQPLPDVDAVPPPEPEPVEPEKTVVDERDAQVLETEAA